MDKVITDKKHDMKKLILILVALLLITSCEKKYCWDCTTFISIKYIYGTFRSYFTSDNVVLCDHTEEEISEYEKRNTSVDTVRMPTRAYDYVYKKSCYCQK